MARLGRPGAALEHRPKVFGAPTQTFWSSWGRLGASWGAPGGFWGRLGAVLGPLGPLLGPPEPLLGVILASRGGLFGSLFERAWNETVETLVFNHLSFDLRVAVLRALHDRHFWSLTSG